MKILTIVFILFLVSFNASANIYEMLSAEYMLAGDISLDDVEGVNTHLYIRINGKDAMKIYHAINAEERENECLAMKEKTTGHMSCYLADPESESYCIFSINLQTAQIETGEVC